MGMQLWHLYASPAFWGWGLCIAWKALLAPYTLDNPLTSVTSIAVLLVVAIFWSRRPSPTVNPWMLRTIALVGLMGTLGVLSDRLGIAFLSDSVIVLASGANFCVMLLIALLWSMIFAQIPMATGGLIIGASYITASVIALGLLFLPEEVQAGAALLLLPVSVGCVSFCSLQLRCAEVKGLGEVYREKESFSATVGRICLGEQLRSYPWRLVLVLAFFAFAVGISRTHTTAALDVSCAGIAGIILIACTIIAYVRVSAFLLYKAVIPLMLGCLLVGILSGADTLAAQVAINVSYAFAQMLLLLLLCDKSYRFGVSIIFLYGIGRACLSGALLLGSLAGRTIDVWLGASSFVSVEVIYGIVLLGSFCAIVFWMSSDDGALAFSVTEAAGESSLEVESAAASELIELEATNYEKSEYEGVCVGEEGHRTQLLQDLIASRCQAISQEYHLSKRESEVLVLLAWGKSAKRIEELLVLSSNTVKTHVRHIYTKLGIHSRAELEALVDVGLVE